MAVNKYKPHIYVIPEDDANRQIAVGFEKDDRLAPRTIQILPNAGGWEKAIDKLRNEYEVVLRSNGNANVVVLIDNDNRTDRISTIVDAIPEDLKDRVLILGTLRDPEALKSKVNLHFEQIGEQLANECRRDVMVLWQHDEFFHVKSEIQRAKVKLRGIMFQVDGFEPY